MSVALSIGFVGTGIMGGHMARRLAAAGHRVKAWNRTTEKAQALSEHGVVRARWTWHERPMS
jgi:3-hydroxyisobutyrate dehydrogenase-like beta-hydroxyacid dehydrogenase